MAVCGLPGTEIGLRVLTVMVQDQIGKRRDVSTDEPNDGENGEDDGKRAFAFHARRIRVYDAVTGRL